MKQKLNIAIDGYSSCGKSTLAKDLAKKLNYLYIDSGAMYRAVTLYFLNHQVSLENKEDITNALSNIHIRFSFNHGEYYTILNGKNVEREIRDIHVNSWVSPVAALSEVRKSLVAQQRELGKNNAIIMDGRDIGTVVFPKAELKIFLTASIEVRVQRRFLEMKQKGYSTTSDEVMKSIQKRDMIDMSREDSPLKRANHAVEIDNSNLTKQQQLDLVHHFALQRMREICKNPTD